MAFPNIRYLLFCYRYLVQKIRENEICTLSIDGSHANCSDSQVIGTEMDGEEKNESGPGGGFGCYVGDYYASYEHA